MTRPEEKEREDLGRTETEKLASNFGETLKSKKEKELILEKEKEKKENRRKVGEMITKWETEKMKGPCDGNLSPRKRIWRSSKSSKERARLNRPGGGVGQDGGAGGHVRRGGGEERNGLVTGSTKGLLNLNISNISSVVGKCLL